MVSLYTFTSPLHPCGYLPDRDAQLDYEIVAELSPEEFETRLHENWRRFGHVLFRPRCPTCQRCRSLRIPVRTFRPNRSQKRTLARNDPDVRRTIHAPTPREEHLRLYERFHAERHQTKGWKDQADIDPASYAESFTLNPYRTEEWRYHIGDRLVGVGYVDPLPEGLSAIYFIHEPAERSRGLGIYNVLCLIREAESRNKPYVYLGYYVEDSPSMQYKATFRPNELLDEAGVWRPFR